MLLPDWGAVKINVVTFINLPSKRIKICYLMPREAVH